jgi:hypothetical protein
MTWVLLLLGLLALLLLVPFHLELLVETAEDLRVEARPRWGVFPVTAWHSGATSTRIPERRRARAGKVRVHNRKPTSWRKVRALLTSEEFLASLGRWLRRLVRQLGPTDVRMHLRLGTGDPGETGMLWAALAPLFALLGQATPVELELEPDFLDRAFALEARGRLRIVPLVLLVTALGYFLTPAPWRAVRHYRRA